MSLMLMLKFLKTMAKKIPYQVWFLIGAVLAFWLYGVWQYNKGQADVQSKWDASVARGKVLVEELKDKSLTVNMIVDTQWKERVEYIYERSDPIIKEIPIYIPVDTPDLPGGFRVLHDAAVNLTGLPGTPSSVEAAPVPVRTAAETITLNYQKCHLWRAEALSWRQWHTEQSQLWQTAQRKQRE